jgi:hypothetical protein
VPWADEIYKSVDADGHVVYSNRKDSSTTQQLVVLGDALTPPDVMHFCWTSCFTLAFDHDSGLYKRVDGSDETWTVRRFTASSILLMRHDAPAAWNGFSQDVPYEGQVANGRLINVKVAGRATSGVDMAWGMALNTLPGSNAERDQHNSAQAVDAATAPPSANIDAAIDVDVRTTEAPPPLPNDEQPPCPEEGYLWTPGYWAWSGAGYAWVPGAWVQPPRVGVLWTPGYWGFVGSFFVYHRGYWGPHIGYYGGINYGFGYGGVGYAGGRWVGNSFAYNRAVNNLNATVIRNTYQEPVIINGTVNKVSYNGGPAGTNAAPTAQERAASAEAHVPATSQTSHMPKAPQPAVARTPAAPARPVPSPPAGESAYLSTGQSNPPEQPKSGTGQAVAPRATHVTPTKPLQHP